MSGGDRDLKVEIAVLQTQMDEISRRVERMSVNVEKLTMVMNRGWGAFSASLILAGAIGAFIMKGIDWIIKTNGGAT